MKLVDRAFDIVADKKQSAWKRAHVLFLLITSFAAIVFFGVFIMSLILINFGGWAFLIFAVILCYIFCCLMAFKGKINE